MKNNISHIINSFESPVNPALFDQIIKSRNARNRKKKWGIWASFLAIFVMGTASFLFWGNPKPPKQTQKQPEMATATTHLNKKNLRQQPRQLPLAEKSLSENPLAEKSAPQATPTKNRKQLAASFPKTHKSDAQNLAPRQTNVANSPNQAILPAKNTTPAESSLKLAQKRTPVAKNTALLPGLVAFMEPTPYQLPLPNHDCYSFNGRNRNPSTLFLDILGSPDWVQSTLATRTRDFNSYQTTRESTEKPEFSYSAQVGIGLETGSGIVFRTGVNYSRYETKFYKKDPAFKKVTINQIFDQQGNLIKLDTITTIGTYEIQHYNKQVFIGIPLTIGYTTAGKKLDIGLNMGLQFNIKNQADGRIIGTDGQVSNLTISSTNTKPIYKSNVGIQGIANLNLALEINKHLDLIVAPHVKITPNPITTTDYPLTEKLLTTGLWVGGRIRF